MIGKIILGRYKIIDKIGQGGMSSVYLAEHLSLHNQWAIKVVHKNGRKPVALLAEPNILKKLSHFALPRIVDISEDEEELYIIMDYIDGIELGQMLSARGQFDENQVVAWGKELCDVIGYLHHQSPPIIYRDLKPGNLIVDKNNHLRLIDFGIAVQDTEETAGDENIYFTRGYAAPEQYLANAPKDSRIDIYALGATLYALCTGKNPGSMGRPLPPIYEFYKGVSDGLDTIIRICMEENPDRRFQLADQLLYALTHIKRYNKSYQKERRKYQLGIVTGLIGIILSAALIFGGAAVCSRDKYQKYAGMVAAGSDEVRVGNYEAARDQFDQAILLQPEMAEAYLAKASTYFSAYQYEECLAYITKTVMHELPQAAVNGNLSYLLGKVYDQCGDLKEALYYFEKAVKEEPEQNDYLKDYLFALIQSGEYELAERLLVNWENAGGSRYIQSYFTAFIAAGNGDIDAVEAEVLVCLEQQQDTVLQKNAVLLLADVYQQKASSSGQIEWYEMEVELFKRAEQLMQGGPDMELIEKKGEISYQLAKRTGLESDYMQAADCFRRLLDYGYQRPYLYRNIAIIYQTQGQWAEAEMILLEMCEHYPEDYQGRYQLAFLYLERENQKTGAERNYDAVQSAYKEVLKLTRGTTQAGEIEPLVHILKELKDRGWIKWEP